MNRLNQVKRMTQMIQSNQSISAIYISTSLGKSSISLTFFWKTFDFIDLFLGNVRFRWPFGIFWINSIDSIIPIPKSQSTQLPTFWKWIYSVTDQLAWKRNWSDSINFAEKWIYSNQSIQSSWIVYKSSHKQSDIVQGYDWRMERVRQL